MAHLDIEIKNISTEVLTFDYIKLADQSINPNEIKEIYPLNFLSTIQRDEQLKGYIETDKILIIKDGVQGTKQQSLDILVPVVNW